MHDLHKKESMQNIDSVTYFWKLNLNLNLVFVIKYLLMLRSFIWVVFRVEKTIKTTILFLESFIYLNVRNDFLRLDIFYLKGSILWNIWF